jgi:hypothetical protein
MNAISLESRFVAIGARFRMRPDASRWRSDSYAIDIQRDRHGEFFELRVTHGLQDVVDATVLQCEPKDRHLLLLIRRADEPARKDRFLCGHDEREWFVAAVPGTASTVRQAKDALQPRIVRAALNLHRVRERERHLRKNDAFRRQGEWFFIPEPRLRFKESLVLRNEPIRRGLGKPHIVEELYREGGELVYVCSEHPIGVTDHQYRAILSQRASAAGWDWRTMRRNPRVYARGAIRHPDHATIRLPDWSRVVLNTETDAPSMPRMAFLD